MIRLPGTLTIAAVGKMRTPHWRAAQEDYAKRIRRYTQLRIVEVRDYLTGGMTDDVAVCREGAALTAAVAKAKIPWVIAMDAQGRHTTSQGLARYLHKQVSTYRDVAFLIGGPVGLAPDVLTSANDTLSLSPLTFPHELARVMLLEQLYRALTILSGEQYHK
ncbi:MAG: 23S rRNA (pseudouridine(1915)-N(3))-methyltransferase RlmH [Anaerolineae bacterium]|nr:23S rRNA (pseudouridine(1915)-N(3))-methyltransferase RlmH [Anaerolineae bacterium]